MSHTNKNIWVRLVDVPCYRKHAKGYTAYQIILKVFPGDSPEACAQICVWKRFSEIFSFYRTMCNIHRGLFLKGSLPQLPSSNYFKRFEPEVVEQRRTAVLAFFRAILLHTPLFSNEAFTKFFQDGEHSTVNQLEMVTDSPLLPSPIVQPSTVDKRDADTASQLSQLTPSLSTEPSQSSSESPDPLQRLDHHHQQQHKESMSSVLSDESSCESAVHHDSDSSDTDLATLIPNLATLSTADSSVVGNDGCDSSKNLSPDLSQLTTATDDDETVSRNFSIDGVSEPVTCGDVSQLNNSSIDGVGELMTGNEVNRSPSLISIIDSDNTGDYLIQGSTEICLAQEFDRQGKYWEAFNQYSKGIGTLLNGVQGDMVHQRRESVRARLVSYLDRAEQLDSICRNLTPADTPQKLYRQCSAPPVCSEKKPVRRYSGSCNCCVSGLAAAGVAGEAARRAGVWPCSASQLARYKVLGVRGRLLSVRDTGTGERRVIKVVRKCGGLSLGRCSTTFLPENVPYLVHLYECIETYSAYYLVLEDLGERCTLLEYIRDNQSAIESACPPSENFSNNTEITHSEDPSNSEDVPLMNETTIDATIVNGVRSEIDRRLDDSPSCTPPVGSCDNYLSVFEDYAQSFSGVQLAKTLARDPSIDRESIAESGGSTEIGVSGEIGEIVARGSSDGDLLQVDCTAPNDYQISRDAGSTRTDDILELSRRLLYSVDSTINSPFFNSKSKLDQSEADKTGSLPDNSSLSLLVDYDLTMSRDSLTVNDRCVSCESRDTCLPADRDSLLNSSASQCSDDTDTSAYSASHLVLSDPSSDAPYRGVSELTPVEVSFSSNSGVLPVETTSCVGTVGERDSLVISPVANCVPSIGCGGGDCDGNGQGGGSSSKDGLRMTGNGDNFHDLSTYQDSISDHNPADVKGDHSHLDEFRSGHYQIRPLTSTCDSEKTSGGTSLSDHTLAVHESSIPSEELDVFPDGEDSETSATSTDIRIDRDDTSFGASVTNTSTTPNDREVDSSECAEAGGLNQLSMCSCVAGDDSWPAAAGYRVPEKLVKIWLAQLVVCLERIHQLGIVCGGLTFDNLLITKRQNHSLSFGSVATSVINPAANSGVTNAVSGGVKTPSIGGVDASAITSVNELDVPAEFSTNSRHTSTSSPVNVGVCDAELRLTYFCRLRSVWRDPPLLTSPLPGAPPAEAVQSSVTGSVADWQSLAAILFPLLTGSRYCSCKQLQNPKLSAPASDLLQTLLSPAVSAEAVKKHTFFNGVDWQRLALYRY